MTMLLEPSALQRKSLELLEAAERDPRLVNERVAAAEAHLRLVVVGAGRDRTRKLLDRARSLDPYRADTYFLLGIELFKSGAFGGAIEALDHAVMLAPSDMRVRFHRAFALLEGARRSHSTDLADAAREDFEAVLAADKGHKPAALGAIEATIYGKAKKLRESLKETFGRVTPEAALVRPITRLLYQAIFAFGVGKAKNVDQQNKKTMAEIVEVARAWLSVGAGDPLLGGVIAAATAKCNTAEEICEHLAAYARDIPDVRIVRLLVRERLAEISDPTKRLEMFAAAMERIPPLDGIAQDYLQLVHLVAKRAVAEGDLDAARASWQLCLSKDADNPATVQNLLRLAEHQGNTKETTALRAKLAELFGLYAALSPRADTILARAAGRFLDALAKRTAALSDRAQKEDKGPTVNEIDELTIALVRADATARLGVDAAARERTPQALVKQLVDPSVPGGTVFEEALAVLNLPLSQEAPAAYAFYEVSKDAPEDVLVAARDKHKERWTENANNPEMQGPLAEHFKGLIERAEQGTSMLFDANRRAEYDRSTAHVELAEFYRRHHDAVLDLVKLAREISDDDVPRRVDVAGRLHRLRDPIVGAYIASGERDEAWLTRSMSDVAYGSIMKRGYEAMNQGKPEIAVDLARPYLETGSRYFRIQRLYARAILEDARVSLGEAIATCRKHARRALESTEPADPPEVVAEVRSLAEESDELLVQRGAAERSRNALAKNQSQTALAILWAGHPRARGSMPTNQYPVGQAWAQVEPAGRGLYAWCVAQSMRSNTIDWYNAQHPTSQWELGNQKMAALKVARICDKWVRYAKAAVEDESLPRVFIQQIQEALNNLTAALERDRNNLSG